MASLGGYLEQDTVPDTGNGGGGEPHPVGIYEFEMRESDVKATGGGTGLMAAYVAFGTGNSQAPSDNKDKRVWVNFNIKNKSAQAQSIGQSQYKALYEACGGVDVVRCEYHQMEETDRLHFLPFWAEVVHEQRKTKDSGYKELAFKPDGSPDMQAVFKRFMFEGMDDVAQSPPPSKAPAQKSEPEQKPAPAAGRARPWSKP
jgi:hypothetical protein